MFDYFLGAMPHFLAYFGTIILLAAAFLTAYVAVTPHREFRLIREGNSSAAAQLVGSFLGFAVPMAMVAAHSVSILDMVLWGVVVLAIQLITFFVLSRLFSGIERRITENCASSGIFMGGMSLGVGILQAACMVP